MPIGISSEKVGKPSVRLWTSFFILLLSGTGSRPIVGLEGVPGSSGFARVSEMSPSATPAQNAVVLAKIFANHRPATFHIGVGTFLLPCGSSFIAAGAVSLIGEGPARTILRLDRSCITNRPLMQWVSKSGVHLSGLRIDLAHSRFSSVQSVLEFQAYDGNASGLNIDNVAIVNGTSPSFEIGVAAAGGFTYSGVIIDHNNLELEPARSQNECIALTTVNNSGKIPHAKIMNNVCRGSGIQADGQGPLIANNNVSGFEFGQGIFIAYVTKSALSAANWVNGVVTFHVDRRAKFTRGEKVTVFGVLPVGYNGDYKIRQVNRDGFSASLVVNPGVYARGGYAAPQPSSQYCIIRDNFIHDTRQSIDVNKTPPGGIENNCINSVVINNRVENLGGPGYVNFADAAQYIHNIATAVGYLGSGSACGDGDGASFVAFDNGSGIAGYQSNGLYFDGNRSVLIGMRPRFGYFEEPYHHFTSAFKSNFFRGAEKSMVVRTNQ